MSNKVITRRALREQRRQKTSNYRRLKKGSAVVGTALVAVSVAAPLLKTHEVEAVDNTNATMSNVDKQAFVKKVSDEITPLAKKHDLYASVLIAQAIVESDWGQNEFAQAPYFNLFGLEGQYQGTSAMLSKTNPETNQVEKKEMKKYSSYKEAIEDYIEILKTTSRDGSENYFSGTWRSNSDDYQAAASALEGRFTTEENYSQKLVQTIQEYNLSDYDATEPVVAPVAQPAATTTVQTPAQTYTVQSGDTVSSIAERFGVGIQDIIDWNKMNDNNIYAGQTIIVGSEAVAETPAPEQPVDQTTDLTNQSAPAAEQMATDSTAVATPTPMDTAETPVTDQVVTPEVVQPEQAPANDPAVTPEATQPEQAPAQDSQENPVANDQAAAPEQAAPEQAPSQQTQDQTTQNQAADQTASTDQTQQSQPTQQTSQGQQIVNEADKYIGTPYVWGGKDPSGFDCSGLTQYVYKQVTGKDIGSWTVPQESSGTQISVSEAQQGDLLFWGNQGGTTHVAISAGGDQYIHAPQPGQSVSYGSTQYYAPDFGVRVN